MTLAVVTTASTPAQAAGNEAGSLRSPVTGSAPISTRSRYERMRHHARFLNDRGHLREGVTLGEATDVLWTCSSVEIYDLLVVQRGWPLPRFAKFVADFMITALLPTE